MTQYEAPDALQYGVTDVEPRQALLDPPRDALRAAEYAARCFVLLFDSLSDQERWLKLMMDEWPDAGPAH